MTESLLERARRGALPIGEAIIDAHAHFETGFNYSSEHNEGNSWYSASKVVDKRIQSMDAWEQATREDRLFALDPENPLLGVRGITRVRLLVSVVVPDLLGGDR